MGRMKLKKSKEIQLYLQALSSLCMSSNLAYYYTMYSFGWTGDSIFVSKALRTTLSMWDINSSDSLKFKLNWLLNDGWRKKYSHMYSFWSTLSDSERGEYIQSLSKEEDQYAKLYIVDYYMKKLPVDGIAAFDYGWYIFLCRAGNSVGYLTKKEAKMFMLGAAKRIQKSYSSWHEYVTAFVCGTQFKASDITFAFPRAKEAHITKLFASKNSPMNKIDWNIDLSSKED